jgi:hypothetical protein
VIGWLYCFGSMARQQEDGVEQNYSPCSKEAKDRK